MNLDMSDMYLISETWFPSPTGVKYYEFGRLQGVKTTEIPFPSPTGVKYYEFVRINGKERVRSFRPQQGLSIMNS